MAKNNEKNKNKIDKDWIIQDILVEYGEPAAQVLLDHGIYCVACGMSMYETLEEGVNAHDLALEPILKDLQELKEIDDDDV